MLRLVVAFLLFGCMVVSAQDARNFSKYDNAPRGSILEVLEEDGRLWFVLEKDEIVYQKKNRNYQIGFYDGYDFYTFPLRLEDEELKTFRKFSIFQDSMLMLQFEGPSQILFLNKKKLEIKHLIQEEEVKILEGRIVNGEFYFIRKKDGQFYVAKYDGKSETTLFPIADLERVGELFVTSDNFVYKQDYCHTYLYDIQGELLRKISKEELLLDRLGTFYELEGCHSIYYTSVYNGEEIFNFNSEIYSITDHQFERLEDHPLSKTMRISQADKEGNVLYHKLLNEDQDFILESEGSLYDYPISKDFIGGHPHSINFKDHVWYIEGGDLWKKEVDQNKVCKSFLEGFSIRKIIPNGDKLLITTVQPGWFTMDRKTEEITPLYGALEKSKIFPSYGVKFQKDGSMWSTKQNAIVKVNPPSTITERYPFENWTNMEGFVNVGENIYLAVDDEIIEFDIKTQSQKSLYQNSGHSIKFMTLYNNRYVILCSTKGIYAYDLDEKKSISISDNNSYVTCYIKGNRLLASTLDERIEVYKIEDSTTFSFLEEHTMNTIVFNMSEDQKGRLWLGTGSGVKYETTPGNWDFGSLKVSDQADPEANRYAIFFDSIYNKMYIGTVSGLNKIDTDFNHKPEKFRISLSSYSAYSQDSLQNRIDWDPKVSIHIPTNNRYLQLKLADPDNIFNNNVRFEYKLGNTTWQSQNNQNTLTFANLTGGENEIQIRGISDSGIVSENRLVIPIRVGKFFYETWWFRLGLLLGIGSIVYAWFRRIKLENVRLETEVSNRTEELQKDKATIEKQAEELSLTDRMKNQFFSNISHELRTPLTLINSPIDKLTKMELPKDAQYYLSLIKANGDLLIDRVGELLEISRLESGKVVLARNRINLYKTIYDACLVFDLSMKEKNINYSKNIVIPSVVVLADKTRLIKIIQNLINNARKFTDANGRITVDAQYSDNQLKLIIADTGRGISPKHQKRIFDRFYQVPVDNTMANPGTGLGLSMVSEYVQLMGGTITVESTLGIGSTFSITIPIIECKNDYIIEERDRAVIATTVTEDILPHRIDSSDRSNLPTILLAEDNNNLRQYIKTLLLPTYQVVEVCNGQEALEILNQGLQPDIILSDIMMPIMDGVSLLQNVRADDRFRLLPFVFLTAKTNQNFKIKMYHTGVDDYLTKPFSEEELLARLKTTYANYKSRIEASVEIEDVKSKDTDPEISDFEADLQSIIIQNLEHPQFGTEFIAEKLNISRRTFQRILKRQIGLTPKGYIREVQLNRARELYESNAFSTITELARSIGFANPTYFKKLYLERFGKKL